MDKELDESRNLFAEFMAFAADEAQHLADQNRAFLSGLRAQHTFANLRNPGLKLTWFQASRGCCLPPTGF